MKKALDEAEKAFEKGEVPIGAVIVIKNQVIARAHNLTETLNDVTAHAEMQAITAAANFLGGKYLKDCTLYVTLEPCQMCAGALFGVRFPKWFTQHATSKEVVLLCKPSSIPKPLWKEDLWKMRHPIC